MNRYYEDMSLLAQETFGKFQTNPLGDDIEKAMTFIRDANECQSLFYFISETDKELYKSMTDVNKM
jgi:hypothetical protein